MNSIKAVGFSIVYLWCSFYLCTDTNKYSRRLAVYSALLNASIYMPTIFCGKRNDWDLGMVIFHAIRYTMINFAVGGYSYTPQVFARRFIQI